MIYYIGDLNFGHETVIKFDNRPFGSIEEMDKALIELWNRKVNREDLVYIAEDFAYRNEKTFNWCLRQLKRKKYLIAGNHDGKLLKDSVAMGYFDGVDKMCHVKDGGRYICICHYPLAEWNGMYRGTYHVYGHIHNSTNATFQFMRTLDRALNCGVAVNGKSIFYSKKPKFNEIRKIPLQDNLLQILREYYNDTWEARLDSGVCVDDLSSFVF